MPDTQKPNNSENSTLAGAATAAATTAAASLSSPRTLRFPSVSFRPIGHETLIVHEGTHGIFTPIAAPGNGDSTTDTVANLERIISTLKAEVTRLQEENAALKEQLRVIQAKRTRPPDDFASAISHSLDTLQSRMTQMSNPVTDFVVREFSVEAKVQLEMTSLGTLEYKFIQPDEDVDPQKVSKLAMTVVPVPKQSTAGSFTRPDFTPFIGVEEIQGIGEAYRRQLNSHQIYTVGDLLSAGSRVRSAVELSSLLEVDRDRLGQWLSHAQLLTIKGVDGRAAETLYEAGIRNLHELAELTPEEVLSRFNQRVSQMRRKKLKPVDAAQVETWIKAAQSYVGRAPA